MKFYILSTNGTYQTTNFSRFHANSRKSEIFHFDRLLLSKSYKVSAKKVQKSYLSWHWRVMQSLKKNWLEVSNLTWGIWWSFTQPLQSLKISLWWALFVYKVWAKKYRGAIFNHNEQWCNIWINSYLVVSKMAWGIGWTFIRPLKSLKNSTLIGSFCPRHMPQLENFRGIICHDIEGWYKI